MSNGAALTGAMTAKRAEATNAAVESLNMVKGMANVLLERGREKALKIVTGEGTGPKECQETRK